MSGRFWSDVSREKTAGQEERLERIEVPGGWIYRTWLSHRTGLAVSMVFVPRPTVEIVSRDDGDSTT